MLQVFIVLFGEDDGSVYYHVMIDGGPLSVVCCGVLECTATEDKW
jgi:hypothetical protein